MLDVENIVQYTTPAGRADLFLPRRRTIGETKRVGLADDPDKPQARENNETPFEQMERYLRSEIAKEVHQFAWEDDEHKNRSWTGFVTDGRTWHVWRYAHELGATATPVNDNERPPNAEALVGFVRQLTATKPVGKPWVPDNFREFLHPYADQLLKIFRGLKKRPERHTKTKLTLWLSMLKTSGMAPRDRTQETDLFIRHSLLVTIARGVIHTLAHPATDPDPTAILKDGFVAWVIDSEAGKPWAQAVLDAIHKYEWRRRHGDVLRPVYERLIEPEDRKDFGEVYTPDWLAGLIVREILDDDWCERAAKAALRGGNASPDQPLADIGVLDPACGSGSFLYHAALRLGETPTLQSEALSPQRKAEAISRLVNGIDIHPIATEIARATVLRALPAEPPDGERAIQISQGDSLMAAPGSSDSLFTHTADELRFATPQGNEVRLPRRFAKKASFVTNLQRLVESAMTDRPVPDDLVANMGGNDRKRLEAARDQLETIVDAEGNSVWAWFISNVAGPELLSERKIDRIVTNPPWVRMAQIQVRNRKRELEKFAHKQGLWPGGNLAPHFDIAALFIKRCRELYLSDPENDKAGWLVKRSAMTAGHWEKLREWHRGILKQTLNLSDLQPFGSGDAQRCCVLLDHHRCNVVADLNADEVRVGYGKRRPEHFLGLDAARELLTFEIERQRTHRASSEYVGGSKKAVFRQGATITPKVLTIVGKVLDQSGHTVKVRTASSMHPPWKEIESKEGEIPSRWLQTIHVSDDVFPFATSRFPRKAIIPIDANGLLEKSPETASPFWKHVDSIYSDNCGEGRSTPQTLMKQLNHNNKLAKQLPLQMHVGLKKTVLQVRAGDIMRAARVIPEAIVDSSFHYWTADSEDEAAYLVGILNSPTLNQAYVDARDSGRDFVNHVWTRVPIRRYVSGNPVHSAMVEATLKAEAVAARLVEKHDDPDRKSQLGISAKIREALDDCGIHAKLNQLARQLLPNQAMAN